MNVVIINDFAHCRGGVDQIAFASANGLAQLGHNITLFTAVGPVDSPLLCHENIAVHCQRSQDVLNDTRRVRASFRGLWNVSSARGLQALASQSDPKDTIFHVQGWTKALSPSIFRVLRKTGVPTVVSLHDYFSCCPNGGFFNYQTNRACALRGLSRACLTTHCDRRKYLHKIWRTARHLLQEKLALFPSAFKNLIVTSRYSHNIYRPYLSAASRVHLINNPIDIPQRERCQPSQSTSFLFVGRLCPEKGVHHFAQAAMKAGVSVTFVGAGESLTQLQELVPSARFLGWLGREEIEKEMREARALVFPSLWHEAQPLVLQEAAAMGLPVIASDKCAAIEFVTNGQNGITYCGGDPAALAQALSASISHPRWDELGHNQYETYWRSPHSSIKHGRSLVSVYDEVLGSSQA